MVLLNPVPWLFTPGIAFTGFLFGGDAGAVKALIGWLIVVTASTAWVTLRRRLQRDDASSWH